MINNIKKPKILNLIQSEINTNFYDDFKNYQGLNCAKAVAVDSVAFLGGWLATAGVTYVASFLAVPTALVFGGAVIAGTLVSLEANSIKDRIDKEDK